MSRSFSFNEVQLFSFFVCIMLFVSCLKNHCLTQGLKIFSYIFFQRFIVSVFTFRSIVHFRLIFIYGMKYGSRCILLHIDVELFPYYLLK